MRHDYMMDELKLNPVKDCTRSSTSRIFLPERGLRLGAQREVVNQFWPGDAIPYEQELSRSAPPSGLIYRLRISSIIGKEDQNNINLELDGCMYIVYDAYT